TPGTVSSDTVSSGTVSPIQLLAVGVPEQPATTLIPYSVPLPAVHTEINAITELFHGPAATVLLGPQATPDNVLDQLSTHTWVHFACHASQHLDNPADGAIHLYDGSLTVLQIAGVQIPHAELAYLSACQTGVGGVRLLDEAIHLAAAMQLAGYQ